MYLTELSEVLIEKLTTEEFEITFAKYEIPVLNTTKDDIINFLDSRITDLANTNVLVMCDISCLEDVMYQVGRQTKNIN